MTNDTRYGEWKEVKRNVKENTIRTFKAGCNIALHCNANLREMEIVAKNSPVLDKKQADSSVQQDTTNKTINNKIKK